MQVVGLTNQPAIDTKALKGCIENDPALTTKILRVVNSSLFGLSRKVTDLNQALALIGTKPLKLLVLGFSLPKELQSGLEPDILERYWRRTLIKAVAARELAESMWQIPGDDAFLAGLLQDLGMLVLIQDLGDTYLMFLNRIYRDGGNLLDLEVETLGFNHTQLSANLLEYWGLPESIVRDIRRPFKIDVISRLPESEQAIPQILHMADLVGEFLTRERACLLNELIDVGGQYKGLSIDELELLIRSLEAKVPQLAEIFSLSLPEEGAYSRILASAYSQLCDAAESASFDLLHQPQTGSSNESQGFDDLLHHTQSLQSEIAGIADSPPSGRYETQSVDSHSAPTPQSQHPTTVLVRSVSAPAFRARVETAVKACRQRRQPLSLCLLELDHVDSVADKLGEAQVTRMINRLQPMMHAIIVDEGRLVQVDEHRFAVIYEGAERQPAVELTRQLVRCVRDWSGEQAATHSHPLSFSAGVATLGMPPKNFPCQELIDAAERCLNGVQLSGGDSVKSIDIY